MCEQEDARLLMLVNEFGLQQWQLIASKFEGRSLRQCCERYEWHKIAERGFVLGVRWCDCVGCSGIRECAVVRAEI